MYGLYFSFKRQCVQSTRFRTFFHLAWCIYNSASGLENNVHICYKMVDLGTAIRVRENKTAGVGPSANQSLMTFTQMKFAG